MAIKTKTIVTIPYGTALALTPEQATVFVKLIQGAEMVASGKYVNSMYEYYRTNDLPDMVLVNEDQVMDRPVETEE